MTINKTILKRFRYFAPSFKNHLVYLILLLAFMVFLHTVGGQSFIFLMEKFSLFEMFVIGGFSFYFILFWLLGGAYIYLTLNKKPSFLYKYKIQDHGKGRGYKVPLSKSIAVVLMNQILGTLPFIFVVFYIMEWRGYDANIAIPAWYVNIFHIVGMILLQDVFFYINHYIMHKNKFLYKHVHSIHHEYRESIAITTHYVHFVEHLIGNLFPVFIGAIILLPHPFVVMFWILLIVMNALHNHSGFAFPYLSYSVHHDWHHFYFNSSYSSIGLMDKIFKTDAPFEEMIKEKTS